MLAEVLDVPVFVVEDLDHLLAGDHFLDVAVRLAELDLLGNEVLGRALGDDPGKKEHHDGENEDDCREEEVGNEHHDEADNHRREGRGDHRESPGEEFAESVDVVGVNRHDVAVGPGIEVGNRKGEHVVEEVVADLLHDPLGDPRHEVVVEIAADEAEGIDPRHHADHDRELRRKRRGSSLESRADVVVDDDGADDIAADRAGAAIEDDAKKNEGKLPRVVLEDHLDEAADGPAPVFL